MTTFSEDELLIIAVALDDEEMKREINEKTGVCVHHACKQRPTEGEFGQVVQHGILSH